MIRPTPPAPKPEHAPAVPVPIVRLVSAPSMAVVDGKLVAVLSIKSRA